MPLTDQRIEEIAQTLPMAGCDEQKAGWGQGYTKESGYITPNIISTIYPFARVIEQEVSAPLLERIEEADELARFRLGLSKEWQAVANSLQTKLDALTAPIYEHCGRTECKTCDDQLKFQPAPASEPAKWREVIKSLRLGVSAGSRSVSDMNTEQAIAFPLLDAVEDAFEEFFATTPATCLKCVELEDRLRVSKLAFELSITAPQPAECQRCEELEARSVTNIMLAVVPGDGSGFEVYAKSVGDVEAALSKQCDKIEELQAKVAELEKELITVKTENDCLSKSCIAVTDKLINHRRVLGLAKETLYFLHHKSGVVQSLSCCEEAIEQIEELLKEEV